MSELLWISEPLKGLSNFGIQYIGPRTEEFEKIFRETSNMKNCFMQGKSHDWIYFEFWTGNQDWIIEIAHQVSEKMNIDLLDREPTRKDLGFE